MTQYWVRGHAGIGSNTGVLDPIPSRIEDRRLKMQEKVSGASSIFNLRSWTVLGGIGSNTVQDRRSKIEDAGKSFWGIFNLQSSIQARIRSNTGVLDPISET